MSESDRVTLTIDGRTVRAEKGTTLLEAAKAIGIKIPHYCYHPGLSIVGSCRMCLVEIEKIPKLQPSCATTVAEGMIVRTRTPEALRNRQSVLEFLLLNHPLDCPVCDQSGECELQNYYMDHGCYDPRFNENKKKRKKALPIGPRVILDQERCILCTRCVRFTQEITKTGEFGVHERGAQSEIALFPGTELSNAYSGNVVDLCPVGALTDRDFRFQCRVWFLGKTDSICPGCSRGCNIEIHYNERFNPRYHERRVHRLKPRFNRDVNGYWMCDEGRYSYHSIDAPSRLKDPMIRESGEGKPASWDHAISKIAAVLKGTIEKHGPEGVGVLASPSMTNEELFQLRCLYRDFLKLDRIPFRTPVREKPSSDDFLITEDKYPNSRGALILGFDEADADSLIRNCISGRIRFLHVFHHNLSHAYDSDALREALSKVEFVVYQGAWDCATAKMSNAVLPSAVYAEKAGTFVNVQGRVQRLNAAVPPLGEALGDLEILGRLSAAMDLGGITTAADRIFYNIAEQVEAFSGMDFDSLGSAGQRLKLG